LELPEEERRLFVGWFYDNEYKLLGLPEEISWEDSLSPEQMAELLRRMKEVDEHPERLIDWTGTVTRVRDRLEKAVRKLESEFP
jgi:hypothetical protein